MFWERYNDLCLKKGESPNAVAKKLKIASGTVTEWKNGREPRNSTLVKIAEYFETSAEYLVGKTDNRIQKEKPAAMSDEAWDMIQNDPRALAFFEAFAKMSHEKRELFFKMVDNNG